MRVTWAYFGNRTGGIGLCQVAAVLVDDCYGWELHGCIVGCRRGRAARALGRLRLLRISIDGGTVGILSVSGTHPQQSGCCTLHHMYYVPQSAATIMNEHLVPCRACCWVWWACKHELQDNLLFVRAWLSVGANWACLRYCLRQSLPLNASVTTKCVSCYYR